MMVIKITCLLPWSYDILLLLLLLSQLYLWGSPFWVNPTIEAVTFHLRRWCMLGVFLLPVFTCLGHTGKCQDLLNPCDEIYVCTEQTSVYTLIRKSLWGMESEPLLTSREKSLLKYSPQRSIKLMTLHQAGQQAQHMTNELLQPVHDIQEIDKVYIMDRPTQNI